MTRRRKRRRKGRGRRAAGEFAFSCLVLVGMASAFSMAGEGYSYVHTWGDVEVVLRESPEDESGLVWVEPGQVIDRSASIEIMEGSGAACLRVRILFSGLDVRQRRELEEGIFLAPGWEKNSEDSCYYYQEAANEGEAISVFDGIQVPEEWSYLEDKPDFEVTVVAQAAEYEGVW